MLKEITVAIPTYNNPQQLVETLASLTSDTDFLGRILVINNGSPCYEQVQGIIRYELDWYDAGENLGWAKAINLALANCQTKYFCMLNDDVIFHNNRNFWKNLLRWFDLSNNQPLMWHEAERPWDHVAGVGPISNYAFAYQNHSMHGMPDAYLAPILIGFCALYRADILKEVGGLDVALPGGDDFDLSIRLRAKGWHLVVDRSVYLHHIGSQTGHRIAGAYWDSEEHRCHTNEAIIRKHGLKSWYSFLNSPIQAVDGTWGFLKQVPAMEQWYEQIVTNPSDIHMHAETLRTFAESVETITEFGTDDGTSAAIFLSAKPKRLHCYDIVKKPEVDRLALGANGTEFRFFQQSTLEASIEPTDMLFVDDYHTHDHVLKELFLHAGKVNKYILFHDTESLSRQGQDGTQGKGVKTAVTEFLRNHDEWRLVGNWTQNNGVIAIARVK
jgi:GT2 family glycosyltransferase